MSHNTDAWFELLLNIIWYKGQDKFSFIFLLAVVEQEMKENIQGLWIFLIFKNISVGYADLYIGGWGFGEGLDGEFDFIPDGCKGDFLWIINVLIKHFIIL